MNWPPKCRLCGAQGEIAILDHQGPDNSTRRFWRCPRCLTYLGAILPHLPLKVVQSSNEANDKKDAEPDRQENVTESSGK